MLTTINLEELSSETRRAIAHEVSSKSILEFLAGDEDYNVRKEVARNVNTPAEAMVKLSRR